MKTKNYLVIICLVMVTFFMGVTNNPVEARLAPGINAEEFDPGGGGSSGGTNVTGDALDCSDMLNPELEEILDTAYAVIRVGAVALVMILGSLDFGKAVVSNDQDMLKKASKTFIKRLVAMAVILILPVIIDPIVKMAVGTDTCEVG